MDKIMIYLTAVGLGALHAFEPGHGKSIIAAYMIGTKGRIWDGIVLGIVATITHTFSIIILGVAATILAMSFSEETIHAWFGLISAVLVLTVGIWMLIARLRNNGGHFHLFGNHHHHDHDHPHDHAHNHDHTHPHPHDHEHDSTHQHCCSNHGHTHHDQVAKRDKSSLLMLGISGGLTPCPAAMTTLLIGIGSGNTMGGLITALFFSVGLGLVMVIIGVTLACAGKYTENISPNPNFTKTMGILSALIITGLGVYTLIHAITTITAG